MNPETCAQGDKIEKAMGDKISTKMFMWILGGVGVSLAFIFASIITLHMSFNNAKDQMVDRIVSYDKSINDKISDIKVEIERLRRYPIRDE